MQIDAAQRKHLFDVLLDAFPNNEDLTMLVRFGLDVNLAEITDGPNLQAKVLRLVEWADAQGRISELVSVARKFNPRNRGLATLDLPSARGIVEVAVVVAAMNQAQAQDLLRKPRRSGRARDPLTKVQRALSSHRIPMNELIQCYSESPNDWQPYQLRPHTVRHLLAETVRAINIRRAGTPSSPIIRPYLLSSAFFADDDRLRTTIAANLQDQVCILIADAVSLFHPRLEHVLTASGLAFNHKASILVFSPIGARSLRLIQLIDEALGGQVLHRPYLRFSEEWDPHCEFGIGDLPTLQRWLAAVLPPGERVRENLAIHPQAEQLLENELRHTGANVPRRGGFSNILYSEGVSTASGAESGGKGASG